MKDLVIQKLKERGVSIEKVAEIVYELQSEYFPNLTFESCCEAVRCFEERLACIIDRLSLDTLAEGILPEPLLGIVQMMNPIRN